MYFDFRKNDVLFYLYTVFHSDRGSQYTSKHFGKLLKGNGIRASMAMLGRAGIMPWWRGSLAA
jgi:transposase InsO family protein